MEQRQPKKTDGRRNNGGPRPKVREDDRRGGTPAAGTGFLVNDTHLPTEESREQVRTLIKVLTQPMIAQKLGISVQTLQRKYRAELDEGISEVVASIGSKLIQQAMAGDRTSQIFFLRTRGGWAVRYEHSGPNGQPIPLAQHPLDLSQFTEAQLELLLPILEQIAGLAPGGDGESGGGGVGGDSSAPTPSPAAE